MLDRCESNGLMPVYEFDDITSSRHIAGHLMTMEAAAEVANRSHRERTVSPAWVMSWFANERHLCEAPHGWGTWWQDGGGIAACVVGSKRTSVWAVAWWTSADYSIHMRVIGGRVPAPRSPKGNKKLWPFGLTPSDYETAHPVSLVYPHLYCSPPFARDESFPARAARNLRRNPFQTDEWRVLADWYEDRDQTTLAFLARKGADTAGRLLAVGILSDDPSRKAR